MPKKLYNQLICAIDTKEKNGAFELCGEIKSSVGLVKLGLEFFTINGPTGVLSIKECGIPIFLDLKFHDIPNTVAQAVRSAVRLGVEMLTVHTSGGKDMLCAAVDAAQDESSKLGIKSPLVLGVTVLTSMDENDLKETGITKEISAQVVALAKLAQQSGLKGVVCSPHEIGLIKKECGPNFKLIVPGIRPASSAKGDQKRVMTPTQAIASGADYIVIGRPITESLNPGNAAQEILEEINQTFL